jgi:hypothetical protein
LARPLEEALGGWQNGEICRLVELLFRNDMHGVPHFRKGAQNEKRAQNARVTRLGRQGPAHDGTLEKKTFGSHVNNVARDRAEKKFKMSALRLGAGHRRCHGRSEQGSKAHQNNGGIKLLPIIEEWSHVIVIGRIPFEMLDSDASEVLIRNYGEGGQT